MLAVDITEDMMQEATKQAASYPILSGSITNGHSAVLGCLGEVIVQRHLSVEPANTYDYDLIHKGKRIDVKTKRCDTEPRGYYDCSVTAHGSKQDCDEYIFVRILLNFKRAWILGSISKEEFFSKARKFNRGDVDPDNGFKFRATCYNIAINQLGNVE